MGFKKPCVPIMSLNTNSNFYVSSYGTDGPLDVTGTTLPITLLSSILWSYFGPALPLYLKDLYHASVLPSDYPSKVRSLLCSSLRGSNLLPGLAVHPGFRTE